MGVKTFILTRDLVYSLEYQTKQQKHIEDVRVEDHGFNFTTVLVDACEIEIHLMTTVLAYSCEFEICNDIIFFSFSV